MQWQRYLKKGAQPAAGNGGAEPFDAGRLAVEIGKLADEAGAVQVPGGWEAVKVKQADVWRRLLAAFVAVDDAFTRRDERGVVGTIATARRVLMLVRFS